MRWLLCLLVLSIGGLCGCHSTAPTVHPDTVAELEPSLIGELRQLEGDWEITDENGERVVASRFSITSGGSAVREIMWPGHPHEMTNLYHMDGEHLVCTHYCAAGNQPRMVATHAERSEEGLVFHFDYESVTNLRESHQYYMGNMTLTILENGQVREDWRAYDREGQLTEPTTFLLERKEP